ncbi:glycoside hydrolase [Sphingomonas ginkgonis]|uniref:Glycoside hydrolase n=1 Tax=Sphingomonas ginkgonis TaxID=2315330 RepID=A0A429V9W8_9SPHN|nr:glycosyl hydrolase [Sphingomonas ginkgonis]RST30637.1 glycoside hydrolase [Sphingomonas ginkgonis]
MKPILARLTAALLLASASVPALADDLAAGFANPPQSARPRVWWHWMNGNISKDGIAKDMAWMKRVGIGGLQNFDVNLATPQVVPKRLVYMHDDWKDAFRFAAQQAEANGLELAIASSPGWSETGGPWVPAADGLKKLVWSETVVAGGRPVGRLPAPPSVTGAFQALPFGDPLTALGGDKPFVPPTHYADVRVLAFPLAGVAVDERAPALVGGGDPSILGATPAERGLTVAKGGAVTLDYGAPRTIRSATLFLPGAKTMFAAPSVSPRLEASDDGRSWRAVADIAVTEVPTTVSFAPVSARYFRVLMAPVQGGSANMGEPAPGVDFAALPPMFGPAGDKGVSVGQLHLSGEARVDQYERKAGFAIVPDYYALSRGVADEPGFDPRSVIDVSERLRPDGTLDWTPPAGRWRIVRLGSSLLGTTNHPAPAEATGLEVDKFDRAAVRRYLDHYLAMYRDAAGPGLLGARGVRAMLNDSIEVGAANWTPAMLADFRRLRGYDPTPWLPALTGTIVGSRAASDRFLYDYRRTLADLMTSSHYATVAEVAHANGLKLYGEALEDHRPSLGDDMAMRSHTDVPMSALWTYGRAGPNPSHIADMKGAASVAHLYGQNLVAAESMTAALQPWNFAPHDLRKFIDLEFATGVNRPVIHTSVHQPVDDKVPGLSLFIFGQYFNRHESWAELARPWVDYMARSSFLLQQGRNVADVAYFYGEEAPLTALYGDQPVADAPTRYAYDFAGADAVMNHLRVENGELVSTGGARYRLLYLGGSSPRMTLAMLEKLAALAEQGATVVGLAPTSSPGLGDDPARYAALVRRLWSGQPVTRVGAGRVVASSDVEQALAGIGVQPDFVPGGAPDSRLLFVHRKLADGDAYFVSNRLGRAETLAARFRVTGKAPEIWRADTGTSEPASYRVEQGVTLVPLTLAPEDSVFIVFRKPAAAPSRTVPTPRRVTLATLSDGWSVAFQPGRGAAAQLRLAALGRLNEQADPGVKYFSGIATYSRSFTVPRGVRPGRPLLLDLGRVCDIAEVTVNGRLVGSAWHAPWQIDIGKAVRPGTNRLSIRVANLWVNRLIGDAQPGVTRKISWTAMPTYRADAPLRPSGLIGPVSLLGDVR